MPLFHSNRDARMMRHFAEEVVTDIIGVQVAVFKLDIQGNTPDMYGDDSDRRYFEGLLIPALVSYQERNYMESETGQDYTQACDFGFVRETLKDADIFVEVGDIIEYNNEYWEVDTIQQNQFFGGKNPDHSFAGSGWGSNVSVVASSHLARLSKINIVPYRTRHDSTDMTAMNG
jgi:hypothetical protein